MKKDLNTHRVVTFLTREELEFLDKLEKDMMFSTGRHISRSQILQNMAELLVRTRMNADNIKTSQELEERMIEAISRLTQSRQQPEQRGNPGEVSI